MFFSKIFFIMELLHTPVLLQETLDSIPPQSKYIIDGTLGHAGHSLAILQKFPNIKLR
ncbi:MAG: 16S rRNA (cytosine(1402)-N(4))-methyltransferase [bacterium]|nr:16S rRNA (cytosine(1402)-N(4))-methyltransferase [bacterium]